MRRTVRKEKGFSLIEVLMSIVLLGVVSMNICHGLIISLKIYKRTVRNAVGTQLAMQRLEELASTDPTTLDDTDDLTETNLTSNHVSFTRVTQVSINADLSRTVTITVTPSVTSRGGAITFTDTFPLWGTN